MKNTLDYLVKKYSINLNQQSPIEIPGVGRLDLIRWMRELDFASFVEVGVERAVFAHEVCDLNTQMILFGVDPYEKYGDYREYKDQAEMDRIHDEMQRKMVSHIKHGHFVVVRKRSEDAIQDFADESLDGVYVDGNHEFDYPLRDIEGWWPKIKKGGILAGHDYVRVKVWDFTIKDALKKFTLKNNISPWFILGRHQRRRGEIRDRSRSWLICK